jgi:predicted nucleic-acid-binding Zn-ribbon protein
MKNSKRCPKCQSTDIVRIPAEPRRYQGNHIPVGWLGVVLAKVTRFLCASCGFSEEWVESSDDIAKLKNKYGTAPG